MHARVPALVGPPVLTIAGVSVRVTGLGPGLVRAVRERYGRFLSVAGEVTMRVAISVNGALETSPGGSGTARILGDPIRSGEYHIERTAPALHGLVDVGSGSAAATIPNDPDSLDDFLVLLYSLLLGLRDGALVSAACVAFDGLGILLVGEHGRGRHGLTSQGFDQVVGDGVIALTRDAGGGYLAWGTPFAGGTAPGKPDEPVPLLAMYVTRDGREVRVTPLAADAALFKVFSYTVFSGPEDLKDRVTDLMTALTANKLVGELEWLPCDAVVDCLRHEARTIVSAVKGHGSPLDIVPREVPVERRHESWC